MRRDKKASRRYDGDAVIQTRAETDKTKVLIRKSAVWGFGGQSDREEKGGAISTDH